VLNSVLFISSLFLIVCLLLPVQLYGSTILCDPSLNLTNLTNCDEGSSSTSSTLDTETTDSSRSDNTETPLIVPDISPTGKDLEDATTDVDRGTTVTDANNDDDNDDDDDDENPDDDGDSSSDEDGSSDSETSLIPFP
jgi:hypothetical protein